MNALNDTAERDRGEQRTRAGAAGAAAQSAAGSAPSPSTIGYRLAR